MTDYEDCEKIWELEEKIKELKLKNDAMKKALEALVLAFDVGDMAHTTLNGRGYPALAAVRKALALVEGDENDEYNTLMEALDIFFKVIVVDGEQYRPGYPLCAGCPELTIARGWECFYKPQTTECKYPDQLLKATQDRAVAKALDRQKDKE